MKNILFILLLLPVLASSQIKIEQGFGLSWNDADYRTEDKYYFADFSPGNFCATYQIRGYYKRLSLVADTDIYTIFKRYFAPTHSEFRIKLSYKIKKIDLSFSHECVHPIITDELRDRPQRIGGYNKIGISYNLK